VGVRRYDPNELRDLPYSEPDVADLARTLIDSGYSADNVVLLTQTLGAEQPRFAPTGENIRRELKLLLGDRTAEDTVMIAFAGHGVQFRNNDESWFCPADARLAERPTLISLTELYRELAACRAGSKVLLIDACRNEPQTDNSRSRAEVEVGYFTRAQEREPPPQTAALFSCSAGEKAFEHSDLKHGVFFHFVIEGLAGKARTSGDRLTVGDLEGYVRRNVSDFVRARYAVRQMPELAGRSAAGAALVTWGK
jgi:uncharacterized caspase-like protein